MPETSMASLATRLYNIYENGEWYAVWYPNVSVHTIMLLYPDASYVKNEHGEVLVKVKVPPAEYSANGISPEEIIAPMRDMGYSETQMYDHLRDYYGRHGRG